MLVKSDPTPLIRPNFHGPFGGCINGVPLYLSFLRFVAFFRSLSIRKRAYVVQIISCLDSQSKFQMFTLFSGRHVGAPYM